MSTPTPLFLVGVGRSGTTPLAEIVAEHPAIVMGMERFKLLWRRPDEMTPDLLERHRFFDFTDGLTNIRPDVDPRWARFYSRQESKWEGARYVGDKMTLARFDQVWRHFPTARFVCIVREPEHVAASWDARANRASDVNWPERLNSERAIETWNNNNTRIRRAARQQPDRVVVVEYRSFFGDPDARSLRRVLDWLDLTYGPEIAAGFARAYHTYREKIACKSRSLSPQAQAFVDERVNRDLWKHLLKLAL